MARDKIRIGCGAGFADDRIPPGVEIVERGELDYLAMECLAERTIARETLDRAKDPAKGYTPVLLERMEAIMPPALQRGIKIVTNMGAANPMGAARVLRKHASDWDCPDYTCAVVQGDEVTDIMRAHPELPLMEDGAPLESLLPRMASANAYLGADVVAQGFATGADLVITGRVADPALFLGPMLHAFGWSYDDYPKLANGTLAGHLLECSGQLTGGCFADPGKKEVEDLAGLGYPLADVWSDGRVEVSKTPGSGGRLDIATCTEQLLYEMHDPTAYITPDCVLDVSAVTFRQVEKDRVALSGARGKPRTPTYKVVVGYFDGYMGSGEMGFAGINALARAEAGDRGGEGTPAPPRPHLRGNAHRPDRHEFAARQRCQPVSGTVRGAPAHRRAHARQEGGRGGRRGSAQPAHARPERRRRWRQFRRAADTGGEVRADPARMGEAGNHHGARRMSVRVYDLGSCARRRQGQHVQHLRHRLQRRGLAGAAARTHARTCAGAFPPPHRRARCAAMNCRNCGR